MVKTINYQNIQGHIHWSNDDECKQETFSPTPTQITTNIYIDGF